MSRAVPRLPVAVHVPLAGSYSSALLKTRPLFPPATSTLPLGRSVAVCWARAVPRLPVAVHVPVAGSYSSALLKAGPLFPPATSTLPVGSSVAVCQERAVTRPPVGTQLGLIAEQRVTITHENSSAVVLPRRM